MFLVDDFQPLKLHRYFHYLSQDSISKKQVHACIRGQIQLLGEYLHGHYPALNVDCEQKGILVFGLEILLPLNSGAPAFDGLRSKRRRCSAFTYTIQARCNCLLSIMGLYGDRSLHSINSCLSCLCGGRKRSRSSCRVTLDE